VALQRCAIYNSFSIHQAGSRAHPILSALPDVGMNDMTSTITRSAAIIAMCLLPLAAAAQSTKPPTCDAPEHRQFDFWLGDWEVTTPDGKPAGRNAITRELNGCVLHERWAGAGGMKGESFNIWDRVSRQWHQTWVSDNGTLLLLNGRFENGVMELTGTSGAASAQTINRIRWSSSADGTVRQHWEVSGDGGKTWKTTFDGRYRRAKSSR
jgi:hypothetical protein